MAYLSEVTWATSGTIGWYVLSHPGDDDDADDNWLAGWLDWLTDWMVGWVNGCLTNWVTGWLTDWVGGWLAEWMHGWMDGGMDGWRNGWINGWCMDSESFRVYPSELDRLYSIFYALVSQYMQFSMLTLHCVLKWPIPWFRVCFLQHTRFQSLQLPQFMFAAWCSGFQLSNYAANTFFRTE